MKTKAAVLTAVNKPLEILEMEQEGPREGEIRAKVDAAGVCMSDWHMINGDWPTPMPIVLGHEAAGTIVEVGPGVRNFEPGDKVIFAFRHQCGHCPECNKGRPVLCSGHTNIANGVQFDGTTRLKLNGEGISQMCRIGTFSEHVVCSTEQVVKMPDGMPAGPAALISCSVATGVGAVVRHAQVNVGSTVAVVGCGGVGLNMIQGARLSGASKIIAVDLLDKKLELARFFGATHTINGTEQNTLEAVQDIVKGPGVDFAFDAIGTAVTASQVVDLIAPGGHAVLVGMPNVNVRAEISPFMMVLQEKKLTGSIYGSVRATVDFPLLCDLYMSGKLDLDSMISKTIALEDVNKAFEDLVQGSVARSVIQFA